MNLKSNPIAFENTDEASKLKWTCQEKQKQKKMIMKRVETRTEKKAQVPTRIEKKSQNAQLAS